MSKASTATKFGPDSDIVKFTSRSKSLPPNSVTTIKDKILIEGEDLEGFRKQQLRHLDPEMRLNIYKVVFAGMKWNPRSRHEDAVTEFISLGNLQYTTKDEDFFITIPKAFIEMARTAGDGYTRTMDVNSDEFRKEMGWLVNTQSAQNLDAPNVNAPSGFEFLLAPWPAGLPASEVRLADFKGIATFAIVSFIKFPDTPCFNTFEVLKLIPTISSNEKVLLGEGSPGRDDKEEQ